MKKGIFSCLALVALAATVSFVSCSKDTDTAEPFNYNYNTNTYMAKLEGYVLVDAEVKDSASMAQKTYATPDAIELWVTVPYSQIDPAYTALHANDLHKTELWKQKANYDKTTGKFSIQIPVGEEGATPTFTLNDITGITNHAVKCFKGNVSEKWDSIIYENGSWKGTTFTYTNAMPSQNIFLSADANPCKMTWTKATESGNNQ